jgi:hypothetical protein
VSQTIKVPHTIELVTEFSAAHPMTARLMSLPDGVLSKLMVDTFMAVVKSEGFLEHINNNNAYATVRFAKDVEDDSSK